LTPAVRTQVQAPSRRWVLVRTTEAESGRVELTVRTLETESPKAIWRRCLNRSSAPKARVWGWNCRSGVPLSSTGGSCELKTAKDARRFFIASFPTARSKPRLLQSYDGAYCCRLTVFCRPPGRPFRPLPKMGTAASGYNVSKRFLLALVFVRHWLFYLVTHEAQHRAAERICMSGCLSIAVGIS
jgi:hypothetical protein